MITLFLFNYWVEALTPQDNLILAFSIFFPPYQCLAPVPTLALLTNIYCPLPHSCFAEETSRLPLEEKMGNWFSWWMAYIVKLKIVPDWQVQMLQGDWKMSMLPSLGAAVMSCLPSAPVCLAPYPCWEPEEALELLRCQARGRSSLHGLPMAFWGRRIWKLRVSAACSWLKGPSFQLLSIHSIYSILP